MLTKGRFIPNDPSYQDVWQQPLLMTMAYAWALQYWAEQVRLPVHPDYHPLAMSILEVMGQVRRHITFYKLDIFWNLESRDLVTPQGWPITQPTPVDVGGRRSGSVEAPGAHTTTPSSSKEEAPPAKSIPLPTAVNVDHTPPGPADTLLERDAMPLPAKPEVKTPQGMLTGKATSPIWPDQRWKAVCSNHNCLGKEVKSGDNWCHSWGNHDYLSGGSGLEEPPNGCSSSWPH